MMLVSISRVPMTMSPSLENASTMEPCVLSKASTREESLASCWRWRWSRCDRCISNVYSTSTGAPPLLYTWMAGSTEEEPDSARPALRNAPRWVFGVSVPMGPEADSSTVAPCVTRFNKPSVRFSRSAMACSAPGADADVDDVEAEEDVDVDAETGDAGTGGVEG